MNQRINTAGLDLIKRFEQCRLQAYMPTPNDRPTIGWGHVFGVRMGDTCTQQQADTWLLEDISNAEEEVAGDVTGMELNPNQFSALVSLCYNIGDGQFAQSKLLKKLNAGDIEGAAAEFQKWNHQAGVELHGLTRRRQAEEELFRRPAMKPLSQSKTIKAGALAVPSAAFGVLDQFDAVKDALYTLTPYWRWAAFCIAILTVGASCYMVWRRIKDNVQGAG